MLIRLRNIKESLYGSLYWFLTRKPLVKIGIVVGCYIAVLACFLFLYIALTSSNRPEPAQASSTRHQVYATLPPTYTPAPREEPMELTSKLNIALGEYDFAQQQVQVQATEIDKNELVVWLRLVGGPSTDDYFGQLDIIHSVIAEEELEVETVRTIDAVEESGFVVSMEDLKDYSRDRMDYDQFREQWEYFEPSREIPTGGG